MWFADACLLRHYTAPVQSLHSSPPCQALEPFVRAYGQRQYRLRVPLVEPSPPCVEPVLNFLFGAGLRVCLSEHTLLTPPPVTLVGANLMLGTYLRFEGDVDQFAVFFEPAGVSDLFGIPINRMVNTYVDAATVLPGAASLWDRLALTRTFDERVRMTETYLLARVSAATPRWEMQVANVILRQRGTVRVCDLAATYGLSVRQFERRFAAAVGVTPKAFARVARFQSALDAKVTTPSRTWCDVAHSLGYHDQMHLIHDFSQLGGASPVELMAVLGDARPAALASERE